MITFSKLRAFLSAAQGAQERARAYGTKAVQVRRLRAAQGAQPTSRFADVGWRI